MEVQDKFKAYELLRGSGQPPKYRSVKAFTEKAIQYFEKCAATEEKITISGLCLFMGFASRQSFYDYKTDKHGNDSKFSYTITKIRLLIENHYEKKLQSGAQYSSGAIFALKNLGWTDKTEIEAKVAVTGDMDWRITSREG